MGWLLEFYCGNFFFMILCETWMILWTNSMLYWMLFFSMSRELMIEVKVWFKKVKESSSSLQ